MSLSPSMQRSITFAPSTAFLISCTITLWTISAASYDLDQELGIRQKLELTLYLVRSVSRLDMDSGFFSLVDAAGVLS